MAAIRTRTFHPDDRPSATGRRTPLAASPRASRYYPGCFGALFLVLLRIAIGWHFMTEGMAKVSPPKGEEFSAEGYLRAATGPLGPYFRGLIPDVDGVERLRRDEQGLPVALKASWARDLERYAAHFGFDADQRAKAEAALEAADAEADTWFRNPENAWKVRRYMDGLRRVILTERDPNALVNQREWAFKERQKLNKDRAELLGVVDGWTDDLHATWTTAIATAEQRDAAGPYRPPMTRFDRLNWLIKWGPVVAGACLILGLLTPLAALWAAGFLALIYLSMPPWPGLPASPRAEGNYWIVDKNLIEMLACLVLASTPNGLWLGIDAVLFGWIGRRRAARAARRDGGGPDADGHSLSPGPAGWRP